MDRYCPRFLLMALAWACAVAPMRGEEAQVEYKPKLEGAGDRALKKAIRESTKTWKLRSYPLATQGQLRRRVERDLPLIRELLESRGYYDGETWVEYQTNRTPVRVVVHVEQGPCYRLRNVERQWAASSDPALERISPRLRRGQKAMAESVLAEEMRMLEAARRNGYPFPRLLRRSVEIDRQEKVVDVAFEIDPGPPAWFGEVLVEGLKELSPAYVRRQVPWEAGDKFDAKAVVDFEKKLLSSGLFGTVRVEAVEAAVGTNRVPVLVRVGERDKRTIRLGANYSDLGPGVKGFWEHRSLFGGGEHVETELEWNPVEWGGSARFTRPGFLDAEQSLVLHAEGSVETPEAYDAKRAAGTAMLLRDFTPDIQGGVGTGYKYSLVEQLGMKERYAHVLFPLQAVFDYRDDKLNPVRGAQAFGRTTWFEDTLGTGSFAKSAIEARHYAMWWERYRLSSALRLALGSIDGADLLSVPADERFYAGGGGSIRGYEYQSVGPKLNGVPTGGDKLLEFSAELRLQPGRRLGYALFVDGGTAYADLGDEANRSLRYGAGFGLRWFTTIGPLRADVAYPLNPSAEQVERLQFYVSLGQSF